MLTDFNTCKKPYVDRAFCILTVIKTYRALSAIIVDDESVAIIVVSVDIMAVESTPASSVFGLAWQAAKVNRLPTNRNASIFFIGYNFS
ncbi:hypothetical protein GCM10027423_46640 [Spirosoma arcticum]